MDAEAGGSGGGGGSGGARPRPRPRRPARTLFVVVLGVSAAPLDTSVNIAFPAITAAFGNDVPAIQWVIICNVLAYASLMPALGRLADIVGHRRVFLAGLVWSACALSLCALATSFGWLLAARVLQGAGAAFLLGCGPALATLSFPERERSRVLGWYTMGFAAALMLGPAAGGALVDAWGWRAVFWFRVPLVLAAAALLFPCVPAPPRAAAREPYDLRGALGLSAALAAILLAAGQGYRFGPAAAFLLLAAAGALGLWFVRHERRTAHPVLDVELFRIPAFAAANAAHVLMNLGSFTVYLLTPYYLVHAFGASTAAAGLLLAASPLGMMAASPVAGRLLRGAGSFRVGVAGLALLAAGLVLVALLPADAGAYRIAGALLVHGIGQGLFQVTSIDFVMGALPRTGQGVAGSLNMVTRTVGVVTAASAGTALFAALGGEAAGGPAFLAACRGTFLAAAAAVVLGIAVLAAGRLASATPAPRSR